MRFQKQVNKNKEVFKTETKRLQSCCFFYTVTLMKAKYIDWQTSLARISFKWLINI